MTARRAPAPAVKICGLTRAEDARLAVDLGATHLGLNFWPGSPRYLSLARAQAVAAAVAGRAVLVGVFVDASAEEIRRIDDALGLDLIQFHGDERPEDVAAFGSKALRAFRHGAEVAQEHLAAYPQAWGFLFDIRHPGAYGGTGISWTYGDLRALEISKPCFVAGGIGPGTARQAWEASGAWGVDLCSGVESAPGIKDPELMTDLFAALPPAMGSYDP